MSFPTSFSSFEQFLASQSGAELPIPASQSSALDIWRDDDSALTELNSELVPVPTQYQSTNSESLYVNTSSNDAIQAPWDYSWVRWDSPALWGCSRGIQKGTTRAWWWHFGVLVNGEVTFNGEKEVKPLYFLCKTSHMHLRKYISVERAGCTFWAKAAASPDPSRIDFS
ncbi:hypothetical protein DM02DRAFT_314876 [Periconia macrospinosa]|uniref:Uncharacterized protein n=1 Tax=Periconia macrospinosa TaxID=97972 RepID=A0A2V1D1C8_9PLEO|nr:hypothetical protein DM02DRAFT_314876 [Periconia macrospinosa]